MFITQLLAGVIEMSSCRIDGFGPVKLTEKAVPFRPARIAYDEGAEFISTQTRPGVVSLRPD